MHNRARSAWLSRMKKAPPPLGGGACRSTSRNRYDRSRFTLSSSNPHQVDPWPEPRVPWWVRYYLRPLAGFAVDAAAARTLASARLTTCLVARWNWSNAAVEAAKVDRNALTAASEPAGALLAALSTIAETPFEYVFHASSAIAVYSPCASEASAYSVRP